MIGPRPSLAKSVLRTEDHGTAKQHYEERSSTVEVEYPALMDFLDLPKYCLLCRISITELKKYTLDAPGGDCSWEGLGRWVVGWVGKGRRCGSGHSLKSKLAKCCGVLQGSVIRDQCDVFFHAYLRRGQYEGLESRASPNQERPHTFAP